jgi:hypothetical protein
MVSITSESSSFIDMIARKAIYSLGFVIGGGLIYGLFLLTDRPAQVEAAPWALSDTESWPPIVLEQEVRFLNGAEDRALSCLVIVDGQRLYATVPTSILGPVPPNRRGVDILWESVSSWTLYSPVDGSQPFPALGLYGTDEKYARVKQRQIALLRIDALEKLPCQPLRVRPGGPIGPDETVWLTFLDGDTQRILEAKLEFEAFLMFALWVPGLFEETEDGMIGVENLRGAPIVDGNGLLAGIVIGHRVTPDGYSVLVEPVSRLIRALEN